MDDFAIRLLQKPMLLFWGVLSVGMMWWLFAVKRPHLRRRPLGIREMFTRCPILPRVLPSIRGFTVPKPQPTATVQYPDRLLVGKTPHTA